MTAPNIPYSHRHAPLPPRRLNPWMLRLTLLTIAGAFLLFFTLIIMVAGYEFLHQDEIYPGVSTVFGQDLSGMTRQEAINTLDRQFTYADTATFTFRYGDQSWDFTAREL
ncbi:MAG: hypothetical protein ACLFP0_08620, partial [Rhodosalinus sp.]